MKSRTRISVSRGGTVSLFFLLVFICCIGSLSAHDPGMSSAAVTIGERQIEAILTYSREEVVSLTNRKSGKVKRSLDSIAKELLAISGKAPNSVRIVFDEDSNAIFHLLFSIEGKSALIFRMPLIREMLPGHRQFLIVRNKEHELIAQTLLSAATAEFSLAEDRLSGESVTSPVTLSEIR